VSSSVPPRCLVADDCVEDELGWLVGSAQALMDGGDRGIAADGGDGGHVEGAAPPAWSETFGQLASLGGEGVLESYSSLTAMDGLHDPVRSQAGEVDRPMWS
jgi:hypothetical protein